MSDYLVTTWVASCSSSSEEYPEPMISLHIYPQPPPLLLQSLHILENRHSTRFNFESRARNRFFFTREVKGGGEAEAHITEVAQTDARADLLLHPRCGHQEQKHSHPSAANFKDCRNPRSLLKHSKVLAFELMADIGGVSTYTSSN